MINKPHRSVKAILAQVASDPSHAQAAIDDCLNAIQQNDTALEAFVTLAPDRSAGQGPLSGIAVGMKDILDCYDMPSTYGSAAYAGFQPKVDSGIAHQLRRAGATIIGKTVTTEFAFFAPGPTKNPHNFAYTPGGSSSGSAAAIAAGMIPAAIGTQTGGSIIRPASFCGIAGYKPSFRLAPTTGMKTFSWSLDTVGFMAAGVEDVALLASATLARPLWGGISDQAPRIGLYRGQNWGDASAEMQQAIEQTAEICRHAGAEVMEIDEPDLLAEARKAHVIIQNYEAGIACGGDLAQFADQLSNKLRTTLEAGQQISADDYDQARRIARHARAATNDLFKQVDILLTPSAPGAAPKDLTVTGEPHFNKLWTLVGTPCVTVPHFKGTNNMPLGVQLVGRFARDAVLLSAAAWLEAALKKA